MNWTFERPVVLLLCILLPVFVFLVHKRRVRGNVLQFPFSIWKSDHFSPNIFWLKLTVLISYAFFWCGVFLMILSLAGPVLVEHERIYLTRGKDIMFVLDISPSMGAKDFQPDNRLGAAKNVIENFIMTRDNDPVGLVAFGESAVLKVPPTLDYAFFLDRLGNAQIMELGNGTSIGMGIAIACLHLKESTADEKIIILLTDGENNSGEIMPESAAEIAKKMNIRIYTIGIGTEGDVQVEYFDSEKNIEYVGTLKGEFSYDETSLKNISVRTGGRFFSAASVGNLDTAFHIIDSLESTIRKIKMETNTLPLHRIFIVIGFILILADYGIRKLILKEVLP